jgi:hypothetical protein
MIIREAERSMDFYWNRDKQWPFAGARLALILKPWGGFPTSYPVDPVPKPARDCARLHCSRKTVLPISTHCNEPALSARTKSFTCHRHDPGGGDLACGSLVADRNSAIGSGPGWPGYREQQDVA